MIFESTPNYVCALNAALGDFFSPSSLQSFWQHLSMRKNVSLSSSYIAAIDGQLNDCIHFHDLEKSEVVGFDIPVLLKSSVATASARTLCIVGQDPLRNRQDMDNAGRLNPVLIGTPYAIHNPRAERAETRIYCEAIQDALDSGWQVYLTDIIKVFAIFNGRKQTTNRQQEEFFRSVLSKEIDCIKPDLVIAVGVNTHRIVEKLYARPCTAPEASLVRIPHPSPANPRFNHHLLPELRDNTSEGRAKEFSRLIQREISAIDQRAAAVV